MQSTKTAVSLISKKYEVVEGENTAFSAPEPVSKLFLSGMFLQQNIPNQQIFATFDMRQQESGFKRRLKQDYSHCTSGLTRC